MRSAFFRHRYAIAGAIFAGLVCVLPTIIAPLLLAGKYQGIQYSYLDDEDIYRAHIHEILDGYPTVASPYFYEYKNAPVVVAPINEWLYALPAFVIGLDATIIVSKFLLPALLFWLVYLLVRRLSGDGDDLRTTLTAIVAGLVITLGIDLVDYHYVFSLFHDSPPRPILWTRLVNPIAGAVQLFGFLLLLWEVTARKHRLAYVFAGLLLGGMVGYFFSFGISAAILATLATLMLVRKEYDVLKKLVIASVVALAASSWYWFGIFSSVGGAEGQVLALRNGMFFTHMPVLNLVLLAATFFVAGSYFYAYITKDDQAFRREWIFLTALLIGSWLAFNQQVVTGREVWYPHFVQYTVPLSIVAVVVASFISWRMLAPRLWVTGLCAVGIASIAYGLFTTTQFLSRLNDFARTQEYAPALAWLREHAPKDCVVLDGAYNEELERLIPAYTRCNVYTTTVTFSGVPEERVLHNYLVRLALNGVRPADAEAYIRAHEEDVRTYFFSDWNQLFRHGEEPWVLEEINRLAVAYKQFARGNFEEQVRRYRIDYIVWEGSIPAQAQRALPHLSLKTMTGRFSIYTF